MRRLSFAFVCLAVAPFLAAAPAFAHAHLLASTPAADATVAAPSELSFTFSEALELKFTTVELDDAAGKRVDKADLHFLPGDTKKVGLDVPALSPGVYTVVWHATSVDTHKTEGRFTFTVK